MPMDDIELAKFIGRTEALLEGQDKRLTEMDDAHHRRHRETENTRLALYKELTDAVGDIRASVGDLAKDLGDHQKDCAERWGRLKGQSSTERVRQMAPWAGTLTGGGAVIGLLVKMLVG